MGKPIKPIENSLQKAIVNSEPTDGNINMKSFFEDLWKDDAVPKELYTKLDTRIVLGDFCIDVQRRAMEKSNVPCIAALYVLDECTNRMYFTAGPDVPQDLINATHGRDTKEDEEVGFNYMHEPVVIPDTQRDIRLVAYRELCHRNGIRSALSMPIYHNGTHCGMFDLFFSKPMQFNDDCIEFMMEESKKIEYMMYHLKPNLLKVLSSNPLPEGCDQLDQ